MPKNIYAIVDNSKFQIVPKTHLMLLKDDMEAIYTLINFAPMLASRALAVMQVGVIDDNLSITPLDEKRLLCDFTGISDFVTENYPADYSHPDLNKSVLVSSFNFALETVLLHEERAEILTSLSQNLSSFDKEEIEKMRNRLEVIKVRIGG